MPQSTRTRVRFVSTRKQEPVTERHAPWNESFIKVSAGLRASALGRGV